MILRKFVALRSPLAESPERYIGKASAVRQAFAGPVRERAGEHFHDRRRRLGYALDHPDRQRGGEVETRDKEKGAVSILRLSRLA